MSLNLPQNTICICITIHFWRQYRESIKLRATNTQILTLIIMLDAFIYTTSSGIFTQLTCMCRISNKSMYFSGGSRGGYPPPPPPPLEKKIFHFQRAFWEISTTKNNRVKLTNQTSLCKFEPPIKKSCIPPPPPPPCIYKQSWKQYDCL